MTNQSNITAAIEKAKAACANSPRWLRAVTRAGDALLSGELCVSLLVGGALVTSPRGSYFVNGHCACRAAQHAHAECYHRAAVRIVELAETMPAAPRAERRPSRIIRSIERDVVTGARVCVTRCDNRLV